MPRFLLTLITLALFHTLFSQSLYFPPTVGNNWDTLSPASLGWCTDKIDVLYDYLEDENSKAFILLKDGKIVLEKYFGTFTQDSLWYWASAGKTLTAFTVGIAQQEGHLSISDTTSDYLGTGWTVCTPQQEEKITIRHQLTMTSGLNDNVPDHYCTLDTCLQYLADPGTRWAYHNGPYTLLDGVIENATGQTLNNYFTQKVKTPTGMTGLFVQVGYNNVYYSKPRSMARFGLLMLNHGNWNGTPVMTDANYFNQMTNTSQQLNTSYGYLWWLNGKSNFMVPGFQVSFPGSLNPHAPNDMYAAMGKNGQFINVVPSMNLVFIRMGNAPDGSDVPFLMNDSIWVRLNDLMCNTGIESENDSESGVMVYPNPVDEIVTIEMPGEKFSVRMMNVSGQQVYSSTLNSDRIAIDCGNLGGGIYFVECTTEKNWKVVRKVVVK